jgi:hypothetical protein
MESVLDSRVVVGKRAHFAKRDEPFAATGSASHNASSSSEPRIAMMQRQCHHGATRPTAGATSSWAGGQAPQMSSRTGAGA